MPLNDMIVVRMAGRMRGNTSVKLGDSVFIVESILEDKGGKKKNCYAPREVVLAKGRYGKGPFKIVGQKGGGSERSLSLEITKDHTIDVPLKFIRGRSRI